jgi:hypothetical protein
MPDPLLPAATEAAKVHTIIGYDGTKRACSCSAVIQKPDTLREHQMDAALAAVRPLIEAQARREGAVEALRDAAKATGGLNFGGHYVTATELSRRADGIEAGRKPLLTPRPDASKSPGTVDVFALPIEDESDG